MHWIEAKMIEIIALFALIMFAGYFAEQFFSRTKIPDIFLLLLLGLFLGPAGGTHFIPGLENVTPVELVPLAALIAVLTLVVILFEAGTGMDIGELWKNSTFAFTGTVLNFIVTTGACFVSLVLMGWNSVHALLVALLLADTAEEVVY
ncbi:MAG: cation:proton antiporter [Candidatus Micrarchaeota archaeon]